MKLATALVASILSLSTLDTRAAAPTDDAFTVTVQFADLDLDRQAGVATLYQRIRGAARRVCDQQASDLSNQSYPACVKSAVATAVARLDRPLLTDYVAKVGGPRAKTTSASLAAR